MKETFIIRTEWMDSILELDPIDQATIFKNLFYFHSNQNNLINLTNLSVKLVWKLIEPNLKRNIDAYDRRSDTSSANGKKGGRPKVGYSEPPVIIEELEEKKPNHNLTEKPNKPIEPIESLSDSVSDSVSVSVSDIDNNAENKFSLISSDSQTSEIEKKEKEKSSAKKEIAGWMEVFPFKSQEAIKAMEDYITHRKQLKIKPYTVIGLKQAMDEWGRWGEAVFIEAVYNSIKNNWQGVFLPHKNQNTNGNNNQRTNGRIEPAPHGTEFGKFGA